MSLPTENPKNTPWTVKSEKNTPTNNPPEIQAWVPEGKTTYQGNGKNLKILPFVFTAMIFTLVFVFSNQFQNMSADLFGKDSGDTLGNPFAVTPRDPFSPTFGSAKDDTETSTGSATSDATGSGATENDAEDTPASSTGTAPSSQGNETPESTENKPESITIQPVTTTPGSSPNRPEPVNATPITTQPVVTPPTESQPVMTVTKPVTSDTLPVNPHTSAPAQPVPPATTIPTNPHTAPTGEGNNPSGFEQNTHTYDKTSSTPSQSQTVNSTQPTDENLHGSASEPLVTPERNVQSGPALNLVLIFALILAFFAWFTYRKIFSK